MEEKLSSNQEDYLEAISELIRLKGTARVKDIAAYMKVTSASVNGAVKLLADTGHLRYSPYELLQLTPKGEAHAGRIVERHRILQRFLTEVLLLEENEARNTACNIEHALSDLAAGKIRILTDFILSSGSGNDVWIRHLQTVEKELQL